MDAVSSKEKICEKISMPESIREFLDDLYTPLDQEILAETDDRGYVVKKIRRSWLENLYKRGVLNKVVDEGNGTIRYRAAHVATRLESFIVLEKAYWVSLPQEKRDAINDRYIMNPDIWNSGRIDHTEDAETILPIEQALELLEKADAQYYYLAECNCNNYIMGCERDKYRICLHFTNQEPTVNSSYDRGLSERVTKEEAIEALKYADQQGLIHKAGAEGQNFCNCCTCCCIHHHKAAKYESLMKGTFLKTPYIISVKTEGCKGCGACEKRCPFGALKLEKNKIMLDADQCWGCGVCRAVCPAGVLTIRKREE